MNTSNFTIEDNIFIDCPKDYEGKVVVPEGVLGIEDKAFLFCNRITEIILPSTLEFIGMGSFHGCGIREIEIPSNCHSISDYAFTSCFNLKKVRLPEGMLVIAESLFSCCSNLKEVNIPSTVLKIRDEAFSDCESIEFLELPLHLEEIGAMAFDGCSKLEGIKIPDSCRHICFAAFLSVNHWSLS